MPLKKGDTIRILTTSTGKKVRLTFNSKGQVVEAKNLKTGATHTRKEFKADRRKKSNKK